MKLIRLLALAAIPLTALPVVANAQDDEEASAGTWEIDGEVAVLSDYRFRGLSASDKNPEVTAEVTVTHESGFYGGTWLSNVDLNGGADDLEVDLYGGFSTEAAGLTFDVGALYYLYPGNSDFNTLELYGSVTTPAGPGELTAGINYAPSQSNLGNTDNTYIYLSGDLPLGDGPLSVHATVGYEDGAFASRKTDWLVGASADLGSGFTATLDYVDTSRAFSPLGKATAVFSIAKSF